MKKSLLQFTMIIPLTLLLCFAFSCQQQGEKAEAEVETLSDEDVAAIRTSQDEFVRAFLSRDHAAFASMYTEDAVFMPPNQPMVQGQAAIQTWMEEFPAITKFNLTAVEIDGQGDLAFVRGTYSMTIAPEGAPEPIQDAGKYVEIRRKQPEGSWLIAVDIFNSDLPLPE